MVALRKTRLSQLVEEGGAAARAVERLRAEPERFLATVQIGITILGASAAAFGGATIAAELAALLAPLPHVGPYAEQLALGAVVVGISALSIVLGELVPKSLALRAAERYALLSGRPLLALSTVARPAVWLLTSASNLVLRPFGDRTTFTESRVSAEELEALVDEAGHLGALDLPTAEIAARALAFRDLVAGDVMVPRNRIVALERDAGPEEIRRALSEHGRARMPVCQGSLDGIVGYVVAKDLIEVVWSGRPVALPALLRPAMFVPATAPAVRVLRDMQKRRSPIAMVVDEHGGIAGLLTMEDLVEELVGELADEEEPIEDLVVHDAGGSALVSGHAPIRDVNRVLDLSLPEGEGYSTVAGLCIARLGAVPEQGARLQVGDAELEVVDATPRLVRRLRIRRSSA